jgi:hypothetical protein
MWKWLLRTLIAIITIVALAFLLPNVYVTVPRRIPQIVLTEEDQNIFVGTINAFNATANTEPITVTMQVGLDAAVSRETDYAALISQKLEKAGITGLDIVAKANNAAADEAAPAEFLDLTISLPKRAFINDYERVARYAITSEGAQDVVFARHTLALDLSLVGIDSRLANFQLGSGIYSDISVIYDVGEPRSIATDAQLIWRRIQAAGFYDVRVRTITGTNESKLEFIFPRYYGEDNARQLTAVFTTKGSLQIWEHQDGAGSRDEVLSSLLGADYIPVPSDLSIADIASIRVESRSSLAPGTSVWRISFKESARARLVSNLQAAGYVDPTDPNSTQSADFKPLIISIDGNAGLYLGFQQDLDMLAIPMLISGREQTLRALSTYILDSEGVTAGYTNPIVSNLPPTAVASGDAYMIGAGLLSIVLAVVVRFGWLYGWRRAVRFMALFGYYLLVLLVALKLLATTLSIFAVLSVSLVVTFVVSSLWQFATRQTVDGLQRVSVNLVYLFVLTLALLFGLGQAGVYFEILSVTALSAIISLAYIQALVFIYNRDK